MSGLVQPRVSPSRASAAAAAIYGYGGGGPGRPSAEQLEALLMPSVISIPMSSIQTQSEENSGPGEQDVIVISHMLIIG